MPDYNLLFSLNSLENQIQKSFFIITKIYKETQYILANILKNKEFYRKDII